MKHIVMWKLKEENKTENAKKIKAGLEALIKTIPEIKSIEVGINTNDSDMAFDVVLISEFKNQADLDSYQNNPKHLEVASFVRSAVCDRKVVDFE